MVLILKDFQLSPDRVKLCLFRVIGKAVGQGGPDSIQVDLRCHDVEEVANLDDRVRNG